MYGHLDIREHKGKVRARGLDFWFGGGRSWGWNSWILEKGAGGAQTSGSEGREGWEPDSWFSEGRLFGVQTDFSHDLQTPLLVAAAANQPLIVEDLLNLGAEPNATDHQGRSVLHVAATYGLPGVLSVWLAGRQESGVDWLPRSWSRARRPGETFSQHLFPPPPPPPRLCLNLVFRWTWKPETLKVSCVWAGLAWLARLGEVGAPAVGPSLSPFYRTHTPAHSHPGPQCCYAPTQPLSSDTEYPSQRQAELCPDVAAHGCRPYQPGELGCGWLAHRRVCGTGPPGCPGILHKA